MKDLISDPQLATAKATVRAHYARMAEATPDSVEAILGETIASTAKLRFYHPWNEQVGPSGAAAFWRPFLESFSRVQRREDIFFAGENEIDGFQSVWVCSMGHLMGLFDHDWLGIPATRRIAMLRYCEFSRIEGGQIVEQAFFCDILHVMQQAGCYPLPPQTAAHLVQPGPMTHDGLIFDDRPAEEGQETLALINAMISDIAANSNTGPGSVPRDPSPQAELRRCWSEDMLWWGPAGIGSTYTIDRYVEQHQAPFRVHCTDRAFHGHLCRMAEGHYGGFFGWPNLSVRNLGGYLGLPAGNLADMRVIDIYRRQGDKLAENWIFIDMLHFLKQQGLDVLGRMDSLKG